MFNQFSWATSNHFSVKPEPIEGMNPNITLSELRQRFQLIPLFLTGLDSKDEAIMSFLNLWNDLDKHITAGGDLPKDWNQDHA
jgi:hypothetical protein